MKENLQDKLVDILTGIQSAVSSGSDFVLAQLPDIAQQYVAFGRVWALAEIVFTLTILGIGLLLLLKHGLLSKLPNQNGEWAPLRITSTIIGGAVSVFGFIITALSIKNLLFIWLAPKVWLLMEINNLIHAR